MVRNVFLYVFACVLVCCMSSCDKNVHEGEYGVSAFLTLEDEQDATQITVKDSYLWIYKNSGTLVQEFAFENAEELASQRFKLDAGHYVFVSAINCRTMLTVKDKGNMETLQLSAPTSDCLPERAFYGTSQLDVSGNGNQQVQLTLRRVLSELSVTITGVPSGLKLTAKALESAEGVYLARKDVNGTFGLPASETISEINIPEVVEKGNVITTGVIRLMPTAQGKSNSKLNLFLETGGNSFECMVEAPKMNVAGQYELVLPYKDLKPYLKVSATKINDWKEGWTIDGEILNPNN